MVGAVVVRTIAALVGVESASRASSGSKSQRFAATRRAAKGSSGARKSIVSATGSVRRGGNWFDCSRSTARATRPTGVTSGGTEECAGPSSRAASSRVRLPFSATPTSAMGRSKNGKAPVTMAPPSSTTRWGTTPRSPRMRATSLAPRGPPISSSWPKESITVRRGRKPPASRCSTASLTIITLDLLSMAPRPQITPSTSSPAKGGCVQASSGSAGTTSWWPISTTGGASGSVPDQVNSMVCPETSSSDRVSWRRGKLSAWKRS